MNVSQDDLNEYSQAHWFKECIDDYNTPKFLNLLKDTSEIHSFVLKVNEKSLNLLEYALEKGRDEIALIMIKQRKCALNSNNNLSVRLAAQNGFIDCVKELCNNKEVDPSDRNNQAVRFASKNNHLDVVKELLKIKKVCLTVDLGLIRKEHLKEIMYYKEYFETLPYYLRIKLQFFKKKISYDGNIFDEKGSGYIYKKRMTIRGYQNFNIYSGDFRYGLMHGIGKSFFPNINIVQYYGEFVYDQKHGVGREFDKNGEIISQGQWKDDKFIKSMDVVIHVKEIDKELLDEFNNQVLKNKSRRKAMMFGKGSYGTVYKFIKKLPYAFKHFDRLALKKSEFNRFQNEIGLLSGIQHPNVMKVKSVSWKEPIGLLMELCTVSIYRLIVECVKDKRKSIKMKDKLLFLYETALGMEYLHKNHILHRDLNWNNVLLKSKPYKTVKVSDFGFSRINESFRESLQESVLQNPEYFAPEVFGGEYNYSCDIYSFGMMIYQLLFEKLEIFEIVKNTNPSYQGEIISLVGKGVRPKVPSNNKICKGYPWLINIMKQCWDKNPLKRISFTRIVDIFSLKYKFEKGTITKIEFEKAEEELETGDTAKDKSIRELNVYLMKERRKLRDQYIIEILKREEEILRREEEVESKEEDIRRKEELLKKKEEDLEKREDAISEKEEKYKRYHKSDKRRSKSFNTKKESKDNIKEVLL